MEKQIPLFSGIPVSAVEPRNRPGWVISVKQRKVLDHIREHGSITLDTASILIRGSIYTNVKRHVGMTLSRMVRRGLIVRTKPGHFTLPPHTP